MLHMNVHQKEITIERILNNQVDKIIFSVAISQSFVTATQCLLKGPYGPEWLWQQDGSYVSTHKHRFTFTKVSHCMTWLMQC